MNTEYWKRYHAACHAMQTGVRMAQEMRLENTSLDERSLKHLRTGINSALVDSSALAQLLMKKGLISEEEYSKAIAEAMEIEVRRYEDMLRAHTGTIIKLG